MIRLDDGKGMGNSNLYSSKLVQLYCRFLGILQVNAPFVVVLAAPQVHTREIRVRERLTPHSVSPGNIHLDIIPICELDITGALLKNFLDSG